MNDQMSFQAGRVVEAQGWDTYVVIEAAGVPEQALVGPPLIVLHREPAIDPELCRGLAAIKLSGRSVVLVTRAAATDKEAEWLAETQVVRADASDGSWRRRASSTPAPWLVDNLAGELSALEWVESHDEFTEADARALCGMLRAIEVHTDWNGSGFPVTTGMDNENYYYASEGGPVLLCLPVSVAGTDVCLVPVLGGNPVRGAAPSSNLVGLVTAAPLQGGPDVLSIMETGHGEEASPLDLLPWLRPDVYTPAPSAEVEAFWAHERNAKLLAIGDSFASSSAQLTSYAPGLMLWALSWTAHGIGETILRHGCMKVVERRQEVDDYVANVPSLIAAAIEAELEA